MKLEVQGVRVVGGEFRILSADDTGLNPPEEAGSSTLIVGCRFALIDKNGVAIAEGMASNSPVTSGSAITLSAVTLDNFQRFFSSLERDIESALNKDDNERKQRALEELLAGKIPG